MGTSFKYGILGLLISYACAIQAVTFATVSPEQPIFTTSSSMLHDSDSNTDNRSGSRTGSHLYAPTSDLYTSSFSRTMPSMTSRSTATCSFRSSQPVILAANTNTNEVAMRRVGGDDHNPDPFLPLGDIPCFLTAFFVIGYLLKKKVQDKKM